MHSVLALLTINEVVQASSEAGEGEWDVKRLETELKSLLERTGLTAVDIIRAWDSGNKSGSERGGDSKISRREFMMAIKKLVGDEDLCVSDHQCWTLQFSCFTEARLYVDAVSRWYAIVRRSAIDAFTVCVPSRHPSATATLAKSCVAWNHATAFTSWMVAFDFER